MGEPQHGFLRLRQNREPGRLAAVNDAALGAKMIVGLTRCRDGLHVVDQQRQVGRLKGVGFASADKAGEDLTFDSGQLCRRTQSFGRSADTGKCLFVG